MSPGQTFERVYLELKRQLREGTRPPGTPLEPTAIGDELGTSFTPVRDALHRLVGEGLVENPKHNGFAVPYLTEQALRDLYAWNGQVLAIIGSSLTFPLHPPEACEPNPDTADRTAHFFQHVAQETGNREHTKLISTLNDRLGPYRRREDRFLQNGLDELEALSTVESRRAFGRTMASYHQRRIAYVPQVLAALQETV